MAILHSQGWIPDPGPEILALCSGIANSKPGTCVPNSGICQNPAKRLAGQMVGRTITVFGSGFLEKIARRWKGQLNELAKTWAGYDVLPEACHNTIAGTENPAGPISSHFALFLESDFDHQRNQKTLRTYSNNT